MALYIPKDVKLTANFIYDLIRYRKYSSSYSTLKSEGKLLSMITLEYHRIEKGFTYKSIKYGFGKEIINNLIYLLNEYFILYKDGYNKLEIKSAISSLKEYLEIHRKSNYDLPDHIVKGINQLLKKYESSDQLNSVHVIKGKDNYNEMTFRELVFSRHSVRDFKDTKVPLNLIYESIKMAQRAPSVCNRQSTRVHIVENKKIKDDILRIQGGSRGFSHIIPLAIIITFDLNYFYGTAERNQGYVDGGLFTMNFLNGLLYNGLGSCPLHWGVSSVRDREIRTVIDLPKNEEIVLLIAVGFIPEELKVAGSNRRNVDEIITLY